MDGRIGMKWETRVRVEKKKELGAEETQGMWGRMRRNRQQ